MVVQIGIIRRYRCGRGSGTESAEEAQGRHRRAQELRQRHSAAQTTGTQHFHDNSFIYQVTYTISRQGVTEQVNTSKIYAYYLFTRLLRVINGFDCIE